MSSKRNMNRKYHLCTHIITTHILPPVYSYIYYSYTTCVYRGQQIGVANRSSKYMSSKYMRSTYEYGWQIGVAIQANRSSKYTTCNMSSKYE